MTILTLATAREIADTAIAYGAEHGIAPLCVAICDAGGNVLQLSRDERASLYRPEIASAKAKGCLGMGFGGREVARRAAAMPAFYAAVGVATGGGLVPVAGGVLIRDNAGVLLGAIGISGDTADNDELCAVRGIEAAGYVADTGAPE